MAMTRYAGRPDSLHVVNGPEDGLQFALTRAPAHVGSQPGCAVHLTLDAGVCPRHALLTVVSDGYRVRRIDAAPVYVDGKRVGMLRSRVLHPGGLLQVGHTLLCLECAADGLAGRSRGIVSESDFGWALQTGLRKGVALVRGVVRFLVRLPGRAISGWTVVLCVLILIVLISPSLRARVWCMLSSLYSALRNAF
ncbi:MAG: hypothetical protein JXR94_13525 [Candidatus Hydrogenedentes bacterium]|nr:hypothetical protein [Candidatus Hydrogenedentota bacterium]